MTLCFHNLISPMPSKYASIALHPNADTKPFFPPINFPILQYLLSCV